MGTRGNTSSAINGLSLCVQGTLHHFVNRIHQLRFIPVCTGNIVIDNGAATFVPVYPCVYREHARRNAH